MVEPRVAHCRGRYQELAGKGGASRRLSRLRAVGRQQCVRQESREFLNKFFGGDVGALVAHFVADSSLDRDQLAQLHQLLAQKTQPKEKRR